MQNKILFLDHDGVLCIHNNWGSRAKKLARYKRTNPKWADNPIIPLECRFDNFDPGCVEILNQILQTTGCDIVVTSDWRNGANLEEMGNYYTSQGIIKKPIDYTPKFSWNWKKDGFLPTSEEFPWSRADNLEQERYFEIKKWLLENGTPQNWVVVDDLQLGKNIMDYSREWERDWGFENFVRTNMFEGIKAQGVIKKIIDLLA
jgi:hypothetical protein